jgi:hypothetical protein
LEGTGRDLIQLLSKYLPEETVTSTKNLIPDSRCPGRDSNRELPNKIWNVVSVLSLCETVIQVRLGAVPFFLERYSSTDQVKQCETSNVWSPRAGDGPNRFLQVFILRIGKGQAAGNTLRYNIKVDLEETGFEDVDWIHLVRDDILWQLLCNTITNLQVP